MDTTKGLPTLSIAVPPPRRGRRRCPEPRRLSIHALQLLSLLPLLPLTFLALRLTQGNRLHSGRGRPRTYSDASILLIAILARLWRLSYAEVLDWLRAWPALAQACGLPPNRVPVPGTLSKRLKHLGNTPLIILFCLLVLMALRAGIIVGRNVCLDSTLLSAWTHRDPDARWSYPTPKGRVFGYKIHTLLDQISRLPIFFLISPANEHDLPWAYRLLILAKILFKLPLRKVWADAAYSSLRFIRFVVSLGAQPIIPFNRKRQALDRVHWLVLKGLYYGARTVIERFFAVLKRYYGMNGHYAIGFQQVMRHVTLTYIASLIVALVAYQFQAPHLALSPTRVLAHLTSPEEVW